MVSNSKMIAVKDKKLCIGCFKVVPINNTCECGGNKGYKQIYTKEEEGIDGDLLREVGL